VTIPVEIRRALGLQEGDRVMFTMEDGTVRLARTGSIVERTAGVFKSNLPPLTPKEMREFAEQAIADEVEERSRG
jgi:AbrB family looped-hinge helix DNA binding protein